MDMSNDTLTERNTQVPTRVIRLTESILQETINLFVYVEEGNDAKARATMKELRLMGRELRMAEGVFYDMTGRMMGEQGTMDQYDREVYFDAVTLRSDVKDLGPRAFVQKFPSWKRRAAAALLIDLVEVN
jgi:hypothetical protein